MICRRCSFAPRHCECRISSVHDKIARQGGVPTIGDLIEVARENAAEGNETARLIVDIWDHHAEIMAAIKAASDHRYWCPLGHLFRQGATHCAACGPCQKCKKPYAYHQK